MTGPWSILRSEHHAKAIMRVQGRAINFGKYYLNAIYALSARHSEKLQELVAGGSRDGWAELGPKNTAYRVEELWCWPLEHRHPQLFVLGREGREVIVGQANEDPVRNSETV